MTNEAIEVQQLAECIITTFGEANPRLFAAALNVALAAVIKTGWARKDHEQMRRALAQGLEGIMTCGHN